LNLLITDGGRQKKNGQGKWWKGGNHRQGPKGKRNRRGEKGRRQGPISGTLHQPHREGANVELFGRWCIGDPHERYSRKNIWPPRRKQKGWSRAGKEVTDL